MSLGYFIILINRIQRNNIKILAIIIRNIVLKDTPTISGGGLPGTFALEKVVFVGREEQVIMHIEIGL